ncbi:glycerate kinase [Lentibacillus jeotgali]|uniref:glycerate kinase n=1 Tax=Lentibacillus jeotgali TaxID=558169 RepID=UPI00026287D9|nr:glycerate kinase [Lentibacillus jeotgali]
MKVLIAPDSFKGSITAREAALTMQQGIRKVRTGADIELIPMADGGEGTMVGLVETTGGSYYEVEVEDPLGRSVMTQYGLTGDDGTAVIELSLASGLNTLTEDEFDPCSASTYGTGQLIMHALNEGVRKFIICLGGSATNDGGSGILKALGYQFLDENGNRIKSGGISLKDLHVIDDSHVTPKTREAFFQIACDVNNPFVGSNGATAIFGPQKGATSKMVKELDEAMEIFANRIEQKTGQSIHQVQGAGAAGGTAGGLLGLLNAELKPGIQLVMEAVQFEELIQRETFDLLLTGEGKIDGQTASGKVVAGLAEVAKRYNLPTIALAGSVEGDLTTLYEKGLSAVFSITNGPMSLQDSMKEGRKLIEKQTEQIFRLLSLTYKS